MEFVPRPHDEDSLRTAVAHAPVTLLTGPRQAGKSTLVRQVIDPSPAAFFDLEDYRDQARLAEPLLALRDTGETIVIDEAQRMPQLFESLRVLVDENRRPGRFVVLGSASPDLTGLSAETLAGRVSLVELSGFRVGDLGGDHLDELWLRGGLPPSYLAPDLSASNRWRDDYIATFLERDLANLGFRIPAAAMRRFWTMVAHYHGQTWNGATVARSIDASASTVRRYLDALTDALVVRQLPPWFANISKRQVKAPRVYLRDTGLLHRLLGIADRVDLERHPQLGASWEGMVIEQLLAQLDSAARATAAFWSTHSGAELDLRLKIEGRTLGIEIKRTERPSVTRSMRSALADLELDHLYVVHAGTHRFALDEHITAVSAVELLTYDDPLREP
ncbi:ATP-binding protein [Candidatus Poriferisodalis sp.]|uniref:ATP-binding protein n=1 Tax=Candidatus Poriferisodalis sp. TaxID=3101277 RepID=UPI003B59BFFF